MDRDEDARRTRAELLDELEDLRRRIAALEEAQVGREQAEKEQQDLNRIIGLLSEIPELILILDKGTRIIYANSAADRMFSTGREGIIGKSLWDVYPKREGTLFYNTYMKATVDRRQACFREKFRLIDRWFEVSIYPDAGGTVIIFRDITTSWHREEIQRLSLILLHNLKENIFLMRADGRLFHANPETRDSLGFTNEELLRRTIFDLVPEGCVKEWHDVLDRIRQKGMIAFESRLKARSGREFPVDVYANYIQLYSHDYYTVSARDVSERKEAERELAKSRIEANTSKEQTELYLDLMGHDINNLNTVAMGSLELAISNLEEAGRFRPEVKALLERSMESLKNSSELISNVQKLQRARAEGLALQTVDMAAVMEDAVGKFRTGRERNVKISFSRGPGCSVQANELLKDVFTNIIGNAIKHSSSERNLMIKISLDTVEDDGDRYCRAIIEDNGQGIPDETKSLLFKRYVRGKTKAKGSGLGLYLVRTLLDLYGGTIQVEDRVPGDYTKGAKFVVMIPAVP
ncbi:PAS domain S-box protein [Methanocella sp. MCL-LM]|uniref:PAS domain S-box protein n=1 Tax=Methanocella sp. MCL-LM TaxID=3412035 RepID=UPI003C744B98